MKRTHTLIALAALDLAIGFGIQIAMLGIVGVGHLTDAYYAGQAPLLALLAIVQLPLQRSVIAAFSEPPNNSKYPGLRLFLAVLGIMMAAMLILGVAAPNVFAWIYPELTEQARHVAVSVLRLQGVATALAASNLVLLSLNQTSGRFIQCEIGIVVSSLTAAVLSLTLISRCGVIALAYGQVLKASVSFSCLIFLLRKELNWGRPPWSEIWRIVRPLSSAGALSKLTPIIDRAFAATSVSGSMTILVFAQTVYGAAVAIAERSVVAPRLPELKRSGSIKSSLKTATRFAMAGLLLVAVFAGGTGLVWLINPFPQYAPPSKLATLFVCLLCLAAFPVSTLCAQWLAAIMILFGRASHSARIMTVCFLVGVPLKALGYRVAGLYGLAVAMSCYYALSALSLYFSIRRSEQYRLEMSVA